MTFCNYCEIRATLPEDPLLCPVCAATVRLWVETWLAQVFS